MALQNRVTPFGDIAAIPQRGMFTRNRGIIHDPATRMLLKRRWASKAWLTCVCEFKGRHREVMARRSWTELFFLDERSRLRRVTAPASSAVVKPRKPFARFGRSAERCRCRGRRKWTRSCIHAERLDHGRKRLHALPGPADELPDGSAIAAAGEAYILARGRAFRWTAQL